MDKHTLAVNINRLRKKIETKEHYLYFKCIWNGIYMEVILFFIIIFLVVINSLFDMEKSFVCNVIFMILHHKLDSCYKLIYLMKKRIKNKIHIIKMSLWEMIYETTGSSFQTCIVKKLRNYQKKKITLKELVSDISHQTKTPIANIKTLFRNIDQIKKILVVRSRIFKENKWYK